MQGSPDVVVIGGGIVGTAAGYHLAREGLKVVILDSEGLGSGCSFHGTGLLSPVRDPQPLDVEADRVMADVSLRETLALLPELERETRTPGMLQVREGLRVACTDEQIAQAREAASRPAPDNTKLAFLDEAEVRRLEPRVGPRVRGGLWADRCGQVDSYKASLGFARGVETRGGEVRSAQAVGLEVAGGRVRGLRTRRGVIHTERVVIAMGAWSHLASPWLDFPVPVYPEHGENIRFRWSGPPITYIMGQVGWGHLFQRVDGTISAGSTARDGMGWSTATTEEARRRIIEHMLTVMPSLESAEAVHHLAGPRPNSPDHLPILGPVPTVEGAYLDTGHGHWGILQAVASARLITGLVLHGKGPDFDAGPFLPTRFPHLAG